MLNKILWGEEMDQGGGGGGGEREMDWSFSSPLGKILTGGRIGLLHRSETSLHHY